MDGLGWLIVPSLPKFKQLAKRETASVVSFYAEEPYSEEDGMDTTEKDQQRIVVEKRGEELREFIAANCGNHLKMLMSCANNTVIQAVAGSLTIKILRVPIGLINEIEDELRKAPANLLPNFLSTNQDRVVPGLTMFDIYTVLDDTPLNVDNFPTPLPPLDCPAFVTVWRVRKTSYGRRLAYQITGSIQSRSSFLWHSPSQVMFLYISSEKPLFLKRIVEWHGRSRDSDTWVLSVGRDLSECLEGFVLERGELSAPPDNGYFLLFSWNKRFHQLCQMHIISCLNKRGVSTRDRIVNKEIVP